MVFITTMIYIITVPKGDFSKWELYRQSGIMFFHRLRQHDEILHVEWADDDLISTDINVAFKSEEHYHWFLLKQ